MAALHQTTVVLAKTTLQWAPKLTHHHHHHPLLFSLNLKTNKHHNQFPRKTLSCSNQYNNYNSGSSISNDNVNNGQYYEYERHAVAAPQFPRPTEIEWKKELCNSVQLIGNVGTPVQIKHLNSGKLVAWSRLAVRKSPTDAACCRTRRLVVLSHNSRGPDVGTRSQLVLSLNERYDLDLWAINSAR